MLNNLLKLIDFMNYEANNEQLEDFLGYQITADILEEKGAIIRETISQMTHEELRKYINMYITKENNDMYTDKLTELQKLLSTEEYNRLTSLINKQVIMEWNQAIKEYKEGGCTKEDYEMWSSHGYGELINLIDCMITTDEFMESEFVTTHINCKEEKEKEELKYYEICICRKADLDDEGLLKPNARDWSIFIQGYDYPTFEEAKELLKNDMEVYKCDTVLGITSVSEDEFYDTNWQHIQNPIIFKRKVIKNLKDFKLTSTTKADFPALKEIIRNYNELVEYVKNITTFEQVEEFYPFYKQYGEIEINGDTISEYEKTNKPIEMIRYEYGGWCSYIYCDIKEGKVSNIRFNVWCNKYECEFIDSITIDKLTEEYLQNAIKDIKKRLGDKKNMKNTDLKTTIKEMVLDDIICFWTYDASLDENETDIKKLWQFFNEWCELNVRETLAQTDRFDNETIISVDTQKLIKQIIKSLFDKWYEVGTKRLSSLILKDNQISSDTPKDKNFYLNKRAEGYNKCYADTKADMIENYFAKENTMTILEEQAEQLFHDIATVEEAVGYYIETYGNDALKQWLENVGNEKESSEHRKAITKVLEELYPTYIRIWYSWGDEEEPVYISKEEARTKMIELALEETRIYTAENGCGAELIVCDDSIKDCRIEYDDGTTCFYKIVNG